MRTEPKVAVAAPEILPIEESATVIELLMDDLALFEPNLVEEERCDREFVDDDEDVPPPESAQKKTDGGRNRIVGRLGFPTAAVQPSPATDACVYCGKVGNTRQCQAPGCAHRFHHFCAIEGGK